MGPTFTRISFAQDDSKGTRRLVGLPSYFLMSSLKLYSKPSGFQEQKNKKFLLKRSSKNNEKKKKQMKQPVAARGRAGNETAADDKQNRKGTNEK